MECSLHFESSLGEYINPFALSAPELVARLEAKRPRAIGSWREIGAEEYARAFTVAQSAGYDIIQGLHDELMASFNAEGQTEEDFAARVIPFLRERGWMPEMGDAQLAKRVGLIYETNLRQLQAVGRWDRIQRNKFAMPYLLGVTAKDERVRHPPKSRHADHRAYEGILLPVDHPFWAQYFAPLGFRCRCSVVQRTRSQIRRAGLLETSEGELAERISRLGEPWGFNPGRDPLEQVERAAEESNRFRIEGAQPISTFANRGWGQAQWSAAMSRAALETADALIRRIFA